MIDDASADDTFNEARAAGEALGYSNLSVWRTPINRGYGGNQKLGYTHAMRRGYDYVVLLHGDGQYAPESLPEILDVIASDAPDVVLASRMVHPRDALAGGMPRYKWVGNRILTSIQNKAVGTQLSEYHTGYRAYSVSMLRQLPLAHNSDDFHFDTEILVQAALSGRSIAEVPIPTHYGDEECHVAGLRYARNCLGAVGRAKLMRFGLMYDPRFDLDTPEDSTPHYRMKEESTSLHQYILGLDWNPTMRVLELGANDGQLGGAIARRSGAEVVTSDLQRPAASGPAQACAVDLNSRFSSALSTPPADVILALDVIEHLARPEEALTEIHKCLRPGGILLASTGNVAFSPMRLALLLGQFNYGPRGILDMTHTRLFTVGSFQRLLRDSGFRILAVRGFGPPIADMIGRGAALRTADRLSAWSARKAPRMFAFNFLVAAVRLDDVDSLYERTFARHGSSQAG